MTMQSGFNSYPDGRVAKWWKDPVDVVGGRIVATALRIRQTQRDEIDRFESSLSLCTDRPASSIRPGVRPDYWETYQYEPLSLNVVESVCATMHAEISSQQPRPMFLSTGGDWDLQRRTERANKFLDGLFADMGVYEDLSPDICYDQTRFGTGFAKVYADDGKLCFQRVFPWEIIVDEVDGRLRKPRAMYHVTYMDRGVAMERWPDHAEALASAPGPDGEWAVLDNTTADVIVIVEAWHLPSGEDAEDGRHVIATSGLPQALFEEEWNEDWFPFAACRYENQPIGYFGKGIPEQLAGIQYNINKTSMSIDVAQDQIGSSIFVQRGSKIVKSHMQNGFGIIVEHDGNPPTFSTPPAISPEMYNWLERQYQRAFERIGVSQLSARAELPAGMRNASGVALRSYIDQTSKRFVHPVRNFENFHVQLAILAVKTMVRENLHLEVNHRAGRHIDKIKWSDISLEAPFTVTCWATNLLPTTPAGKLQTLQEMSESGLAAAIGFTPDMMAKLIGGIPDMDPMMRLLTAPLDNVLRVIDRMADGGDYIAPEPDWNLALAFKLSVLRTQELECDGAPQEILAKLRDFSSACKALLDQAAAANAPPPAAPMAPMDASSAPMPPGTTVPSPSPLPPGATLQKGKRP